MNTIYYFLPYVLIPVAVIVGIVAIAYRLSKTCTHPRSAWKQNNIGDLYCSLCGKNLT